MVRRVFSREDLTQIQDHGLAVEDVFRQLELLKAGTRYLKLQRPCVLGDGIRSFDRDEISFMMETCDKEAHRLAGVKFVPASGAATRMFKALLRAMVGEKEILLGEALRRASGGDKDAKELLTFMKGVRNFAFFQELGSVMSQRGLSVDGLFEKGRFTECIRLLLEKEGLGYSRLPKGLLKFHIYPEGSRTPFEEHLVEAVSYAVNESGRCVLHFTVSAEHLEEFSTFFERIRVPYEEKHQVAFEVSFSIQNPATDTIASDLADRPFRGEDGRLLFRPGGHGALLDNLSALEADLVFIKNIDNVVPDRLKSETSKWKRVMAGYLISIQDQIFHYMKELASGAWDPPFLDRVFTFLEGELSLRVPASIRDSTPESKRAYVMARLNRPIRVCGMVRNTGEPGGGPFWVEGPSGERSPQIVEMTQIDPQSGRQQAIMRASTHFNPVDLVCGIRDWRGRIFDLKQYVDPDAVLVTLKSRGGKDLKALEHPGLWNGSMAKWITLFVEVPVITFNPVKTVNDLLRREHQPE